MAGIVLEPRVGHETHFRPVLEPACDTERRRIVLAHAQRQRDGATVDEPRIERADDAAVVDLVHVPQPRSDLTACRHTATERVPVAVDVFRQAFDDDVRTQIRRSHIERRIERVVHAQQCAGIVRELRDRGDIGDLQRGVRGCLDVDELRVRAYRARHGIGVGRIDDRRLDAVFLRQDLVEQPVRGDVGGIGEHRVVAAVEQRRERGGERGHAGCEHDRVLGAFEVGEFGFQIPLVGVPVARVQVGVGTRPVDVRRVVGQCVGVCECDRAAYRARLRIGAVAHMDGAGREPERLMVERLSVLYR